MRSLSTFSANGTSQPSVLFLDVSGGRLVIPLSRQDRGIKPSRATKSPKRRDVTAAEIMKNCYSVELQVRRNFRRVHFM